MFSKICSLFKRFNRKTPQTKIVSQPHYSKSPQVTTLPKKYKKRYPLITLKPSLITPKNNRITVTPESKIRFIGIGSAGQNILMEVANVLPEQDYLLINTNLISLRKSSFNTLHIGNSPIGCGPDPLLAQEAVKISETQLIEAVTGQDIIVLFCGLGGGNGTGIAPEIARLAKAQGCQVLAFIVTPFYFEGNKRSRLVYFAKQKLATACDICELFNNNDLLRLADTITMESAIQTQNALIIQRIKHYLGLTAKRPFHISIYKP